MFCVRKIHVLVLYQIVPVLNAKLEIVKQPKLSYCIVCLRNMTHSSFNDYGFYGTYF